MSEQSLQLVQHVVINLLSFVFLDLLWLAVVYTEQVVPKRRNHEELLHHRVHVADAPQVL
jgi:hypothetical protein